MLKQIYTKLEFQESKISEWAISEKNLGLEQGIHTMHLEKHRPECTPEIEYALKKTKTDSARPYWPAGECRYVFLFSRKISGFVYENF